MCKMHPPKTATRGKLLCCLTAVWLGWGLGGAEPKVFAGNKESSLSLLVGSGKLTEEQAKRLLNQHSGLKDNPHLVRVLIARVQVRAAEDQKEFSSEEFMSKFAIYATEMVGWN